MDLKIIFYFLFLINLQIIKSGTVKEINDDLSELIYKNEDYINTYKISHLIMTFQTNGDSLLYHDLSLAFDNHFNTYWESAKYQNSTFLNNIVVTFSKTVTIDRMIYQAPSFPKVKGFGYPSELKIYFKLRKPDGNLSEEDSDFLLVDDIISERTENKVVFIFDQEIFCDQIKLEWAKIDLTVSNNINALASEIIFLSPENEYMNKLLNDIYDINDYSQLTINPQYNDINIIDEIEQNLMYYLDISDYVKNKIDRIKKIINGELKYEKRREFTTDQSANSNIINQHGYVGDYSRTNLKMARGGTDRQPTGIYGFANETIIFYVECNDDDPLPSIYFSQYMGLSGKWISSPIQLTKGKNFLKFEEFETQDIEIKIKSGGPIYIQNTYTPEMQSKNVRIYIEGGILFPLFRINDDEEEFKKILNDYIEIYNNNTDEYYNIVELFNDKIIITNNATLAHQFYNIKNESVQKNMENWDRLVKKYLIFDGIQFEENQPYYDIRNQYICFHLRYCQPFKKGFAGYASNDHIGIFIPDTLNYVLISHINNDSVISHEIGHMIDLDLRDIPEVTNMVLEEYNVQSYYKGRTMYKVIYEYIAPDNIDNLKRRCFNRNDCKGFFLNVGQYTYAYNVWWDIESFYPGYWGKLDNFYRYNKSLTTGMNKNEVLIFYTNLILGFDTGYYFERFGLAMDNKNPFNSSETSLKYQREMEKMIKEGKIDTSIHKKMWYSDNFQYDYSLMNGKGCYIENKEYNIQNVNITKDELTGKYNIFLPIIDCEGHLGFEISENDSVIGFTQDLEYKDIIEYPEDYNPKYKIIAYDRLLNTLCIYPKQNSKLIKKTTNLHIKKFLKFK